MQPTTFEIFGTFCFIASLVHAFAAGWIHSRLKPNLRWLGEVELVFALWALIFIGSSAVSFGVMEVAGYLRSLHFGEVLFLFCILLLFSAQIVLRAASRLVEWLSRLSFWSEEVSFVWLSLTVGPLLGSVITEPAAMTITALLLRDRIFRNEAASENLKRALIATLFVNVSVGGVLTPFAAPPIVMVARPWGWGLTYVFMHFGLRAIAAVVLNATVLTFSYRRELSLLPTNAKVGPVFRKPYFELQYRTAIGVAVFLAGLTVLGGLQRWWLEPLVSALSTSSIYFGAMGLTAILDNAAITYLAAGLSGFSEVSRDSLVAGAVVGGGLTVLANAPNPAGFAILAPRMKDLTAGRLLKSALLPTAIAALIFYIF